MKQVWILNHYAQIPQEAGGTRHFHLAQYLQPLGWRATIIAASVNHNTGQQRLNHDEFTRYEEISGVPFLWVHTPEYNGNGRGRLLNILTYAWNVWQRRATAQLHRPDVVVGSSVHPLAGVVASLLARRFKVPFIFEVRDLWPQTLVDMGRLKESSIMTLLFRKLESWLYHRASIIVVLLPYAGDYIMPLGIAKDKIVWIPNGVDLSFFPLSSASFNKTGEEFILMYFGAIGQANGLEDVILAMKLIQEKGSGYGISLRIIGEGPLKGELIELAKRLGLENISFEPSVKKREIPLLAAHADAFVIAVLNLPGLYRYGISMNKLYDYLAAARPIIIASDAANNPVAEANAGITVSPGNSEELADAMLRMAEMSCNEREELGRNGRVYVEQFHSFKSLSGKFADVLDIVYSS